MKNPSTYPLRLPRSVKAEVERRAKADGISVNQLVATASGKGWRMSITSKCPMSKLAGREIVAG